MAIFTNTYYNTKQEGVYVNAIYLEIGSRTDQLTNERYIDGMRGNDFIESPAASIDKQIRDKQS